jgi:hypothetical protein
MERDFQLFGRGRMNIPALFIELAAAGIIVDSGQRRPDRTGKPAVVWIINPALNESEIAERMAMLDAADQED